MTVPGLQQGALCACILRTMGIATRAAFQVHHAAWGGCVQVLQLENNRIDALPEDVGELPNLLRLDCSTNNIRSLPVSMGRLKKVQRIDAANNMLARVPPHACQCAHTAAGHRCGRRPQRALDECAAADGVLAPAAPRQSRHKSGEGTQKAALAGVCFLCSWQGQHVAIISFNVLCGMYVHTAPQMHSSAYLQM
jgi:hypothetical protein